MPIYSIEYALTDLCVCLFVIVFVCLFIIIIIIMSIIIIIIMLFLFLLKSHLLSEGDICATHMPVLLL